ncbi:MAG: TlpA disulfide reductase family protein [Myxococcota bacterium]
MCRIAQLWLVAVLADGCAAGDVDPIDHDGSVDPGPANRWVAAEAPADLVGEGWAIGDTVPETILLDQYGDPVELWQFWDRVVILSFSAMWCVPCREVAGAAQQIAEENPGDVVDVTVLLEDASGLPVSPDEAAEWADELGVASPVLADPERSTAPALAGRFPTVLVLDRALTVSSSCDVPTYDALVPLVESEFQP